MDNQDNTNKQHGFKYVYNRRNEELNEGVFIMRPEARLFITKHVIKTSSQTHLLQFYEYFGFLGRKYIRGLRNSSLKDFNVNILSTEIEYGLF